MLQKQNSEILALKILLCGFFSLFLTSCQNSNNSTPAPATAESSFEPSQDRGMIENPHLLEASGLAASRVNPGYLWSHNDSGNPNVLFFMDNTGKGLREFVLQGSTNRDWEDMEIAGNADGSSTIYVADFGDNNASWSSYSIYWCKEPIVNAGTPSTITDVNKLTFTLPDGSRDMECLMVDQVTKDIFIVSKRDTPKRLYKIPANKVVTGANVVAEFVQELAFSQATFSNQSLITANYVTAGTISPDNSEILIKNYMAVYYWKRKTGESIPEALKRPPVSVPYTVEPQGEGIAFAADGSGYYTISETPDKTPVHLYFYKKK